MTQTKMFNEGKTIYEVWDPYDKRLPEVIDRPEGRDFKAFCENFASGQIHPIVVTKQGKKYTLAVGRKRLLAARALSINIEVKIVTVYSDDDIIRLRISENEFRSANEAADVLAMRQALFEGRNYEDVAAMLPGFTVRDIKKMDKDWANVPEEIVAGVVNGNVSMGAAKEIAKVKNKTSQKRMMKVYSETGRLTLQDVKNERSIIKTEATGTMTWLTQSKGRQTFSRMEIQELYDLQKQQLYGEVEENLSDMLAS